MAQPETIAESRLSSDRIGVSYGSIPVIEDLSLVVPPRAFTALIGPNGSGKSTVLRALARLLEPGQGQVLLDGRPIASLPSRSFARRVGLLSQAPRAPEGFTVRDLVRQGRYPHQSLFGRWSAEDEAACHEALHLTSMQDVANRPLDSLSGGQRQRAWICMALAQETDILLLDEPTTYLDLSHQIEILDLLDHLVRERGKTVVAVLHDLNQAARYATWMVLLDKGRIVSNGTPNEVITAENIATVFGVHASVMPDPFTGSPMYIPYARQPERSAAGVTP